MRRAHALIGWMPGAMHTVCGLAALTLLAACGLQPLYAGGNTGVVASGLAGIEVAPIADERGLLVRQDLQAAFGSNAGAGLTHRLDVWLEDDITGFGIRGDESITRERVTLKARYQLTALDSGAVVLTGTAQSDAGVDVTRTSEYAVVAAEQTAARRNAEQVARQIATRLSLFMRAAPGAADATGR